jgi:hypothetical protein
VICDWFTCQQRWMWNAPLSAVLKRPSENFQALLKIYSLCHVYTFYIVTVDSNGGCPSLTGLYIWLFTKLEISKWLKV